MSRDFIAFEVALRIIEALRDVVPVVRRHSRRQAEQLVDAASSVAANLAEGNRRVGQDRLHLFRIALGSADEVRAHLRIALAWGWVRSQQIARALDLVDQEIAITFALTR